MDFDDFFTEIIFAGIALQCEQEAKAKFLAAKASVEECGLAESLSVGEEHTVQLLQPDLQLTSQCYESFNLFVKKHEGWSLKRRVASRKQVEAAGGILRNEKSYFVDAIYHAPDPIKEQKKKEAAAKRAAAKQRKLDEELQQDLVLQKKRQDFRFPFEALGEPSLKREILSYFDVPTLASCICASKRLGKMAKRDECWAPSLKMLLKKFVEQGDDLPMRSTEFRSLSFYAGPRIEEYQEERKKPKEARNLSRYAWLFVDVPFREYYKQAGGLLYEEEEHLKAMMEDCHRCFVCGEKFWSCCCDGSSSKPGGRLDGLPPIRLFRLGLQE